MPHNYQLQITKPGGEVELLPLDLHKGIVNIGRDPQNDLVIDDPAAELFHAFLDYRQHPPHFVILGSETGNRPNVSQLGRLGLAGYMLIVIEGTDQSAEAPLPPTAPVANTTPFYDFSIGKLQPKRQTISWSKAFAEFAVAITNTGNQPATFHLQGLDDELACRFEFEPPGKPVRMAGQVDFQLPPDAEALIPIRVTPANKPLVSLSRQKYHLTITAAVPQSGQLPRSMLGEITVKPLVGPGMLALCAVVLVVFGVLALGPLLETELYSTAPVVAGRANGSDEVTIFPFTHAENTQNLPEFAETETVAVPQNYEEMFREIGPKYNLDWRLLEALAYRESGMNFLAVGRSGDMGLMQIIPSTWGQWAPKVQAQDPFDPYSNILVGAVFLANMREFCTQRGYTDPRWMLVAYNWGPNRLGDFWNEGGTWGDIPATQRNYASGIVQKSIDRAATTASFEELYPNVAQGQ